MLPIAADPPATMSLKRVIHTPNRQRTHQSLQPQLQLQPLLRSYKWSCMVMQIANVGDWLKMSRRKRRQGHHDRDNRCLRNGLWIIILISIRLCALIQDQYTRRAGWFYV